MLARSAMVMKTSMSLVARTMVARGVPGELSKGARTLVTVQPGRQEERRKREEKVFEGKRSFSSTPFSLLHQTLSCAGKVQPFLLADIGEGIAQVEIREWFVKEGDRIEQFDKVCSGRHDKATVDISSPFDGVVVKLHHAVGDVANVGKPLIDVDVDDDPDNVVEAPKAAEVVKTEAPSCAQKEAAKDSGNREYQTLQTANGPIKVQAAPAVRRIAKEYGVDLSSIQGSGQSGRILKDDVIHFSTGKAAVSSSSSSSSSSKTSSTSSSSSSSSPVATRPVQEAKKGDKVVKVEGMKKAMAKAMVAANAVPHFGYCEEVNFNQLVALRSQLQPLSSSRGIKISFLPFILKSLSLSLNAFPMLNAHVDSECNFVTYCGEHNVGIAMDTPEGLLVPNIKNVESRSIFEIAHELNRLQKLGSEGKLGLSDLKDGTVTLSNIGSIGGTYASPVLLMPEVLIGAIGRMQKLPRFNEKGEVEAHNIVQFSWSADHRVLDGATVARFFSLMKSYLENSHSMLLDTR